MASDSRYYRRPLAEDLCDRGTSVWYFEVDGEGYPVRQLELYEDGTVLAYDTEHLHDELGGLGDQVLSREEFAPFEISAAEFNQIWSDKRGPRR